MPIPIPRELSSSLGDVSIAPRRPMPDEVAPVHTASPASGHSVHFYENESSLCETVAGFLGDGLLRGEPAIIIATPGHRSSIEQELAVRLIDVAAARRAGHLISLDAQETMACFLTGETPDPEAFRSHLGGVVERAQAGRSTTIVRAYGEMVDVLWQQGRTDVAIRVEVLWNLLATSYGFDLLCGYSMGSFYKQTERLDDICRHHSHIVKEHVHVTAARPVARAD
jgi:hypothetical protein